MDKVLVIGAFVGIGVIVGIVGELTRARRLLRYWRRPCMGPDWRHSFPGVPKEDMRAFLESFVDAFMFKSKNRIKFRPEDKLMDVYRVIYTPGSMVADAMELEIFALTLEREYGLDLAEVGNLEHITLGEVFEMTRNPN